MGPDFSEALKQLWRRIREREESIRGDAEIIAIAKEESAERGAVDRMRARLREIKGRNYSRDAETDVDLDAIEVIIKGGLLDRDLAQHYFGGLKPNKNPE